MDRITCILVDDEPKALRVLQTAIERNTPKLQIVGTANNVEEAVILIERLKPQVVFLDIVMPVYSGFELIHRFEKINFEIVFVTSHQEYAIQAIKCLALAYLLKPVATEDLLYAMQQIEERLELKEKKELYEALLFNMNEKNKQQHKLAVYNNDRTELISIQDIFRLEGIKRYTRIYSKNRNPLLSSYNIGRYASQLKSHSFYLCHKSHLINLEYVKSLHEDGLIIMSDNTTVPLAIRKKQEFSELVGRLKKK